MTYSSVLNNTIRKYQWSQVIFNGHFSYCNLQNLSKLNALKQNTYAITWDKQETAQELSL